jgi:8-amino-7-oxononanoate synthase
MDLIENRLLKRLQEREEKGNLRKLTISENRIDFLSNDYLGLARSTQLNQRITERYNSMALKLNGSTGSRLLSGNSSYAELLEQKLAKIFNASSTLLFNSGYNANLALLSSVPQKGDTVFYDELSHACIKEGVRLSFAERFSFRHNDLEDLESKLRRAKGLKFIVVESVYSMDGDRAPLAEMVALSARHDAHLIIDEAHSTGIWGQNGAGMASRLKLEGKIFARVYTFGKAMGVHGACVCGSENLSKYLVNFGRAFIYTTALPIHSLISIEQAFEYLQENINLQEELQAKIAAFKREVAESGTKRYPMIESESAIQAILVPGNEKVKRLASFLQSKGFEVRPILSPTVKEGEERLRICLHTYNSESEIKELVTLLFSFEN